MLFKEPGLRQKKQKDNFLTFGWAYIVRVLYNFGGQEHLMYKLGTTTAPPNRIMPCVTWSPTDNVTFHGYVV
jgi:hypothetical protein